jgi:hypothetical protein
MGSEKTSTGISLSDAIVMRAHLTLMEENKSVDFLFPDVLRGRRPFPFAVEDQMEAAECFLPGAAHPIIAEVLLKFSAVQQPDRAEHSDPP